MLKGSAEGNLYQYLAAQDRVDSRIYLLLPYVKYGLDRWTIFWIMFVTPFWTFFFLDHFIGGD